MSVDELQKLPETGPVYYELRHGELVQVTRPKFKHFRNPKILEQLLEQAANPTGVIAMELAFRALPEYKLRAADVAFVT